MSLLNFSFAMIYIIHKMLVLLKNNLNYLKDSIFEWFLKSIIDFYFLKIIIIFSIKYNNGNLSLEEENIIKDIRNIFRLEKELNYTAIKNIRNIFRLEKETKAIKHRILRDIKNLFEHEEVEIIINQ